MKKILSLLLFPFLAFAQPTRPIDSARFTGTSQMLAAAKLTFLDTSIFEIANQTTAPATPTAAGRIYFDSSNRLSWKGTNGFTRTFDGTANSANRIYVLPDLAGTVTLTTNNLSVFAATTSAQLAGIISDETGSGSLVFGTNPTITTGLTFAGGGTLTEGSGAIGINAAGTNQSITLTPSGTGSVKVGVNGSAANPAYQLNATGVGMFLASGTSLGFAINQVQKVTINGTTGNLLLGGLTTDGTGGLQFPTATTSAGGITMGTDVFLYRSGTNTIAVDSPASASADFVIRRDAGTTVGRFGTTGTGGDNFQIDASRGALVLRTNGTTTAATWDTSQNLLQVGNLTMTGTKQVKFGATALATIGVSADTTAGDLVFTSTTTGKFKFSGTGVFVGDNANTTFTLNANVPVLSGNSGVILQVGGVNALNVTGTSAWQGGAANMTITSGTGNSRTMTLQTTTSGGTATTFLTGDASQDVTLASNILRFATTKGVQGSNTNDDVAAGYVGEYASTLKAIGSPVSLSNNTAADIISVTLTAGDWDVTALASVTETTSTVTARSAGITSTSATMPTDGSEGFNGVQSVVTSETNSIPLNRKRFSLSTTTTIYLDEKVTFSAGTAGGFGAINARRAR